MTGGWWIRKIICCVFAACFFLPAAFAQSLAGRYEFHIDGGVLGPVMEKIHNQTGVQLLFSYDLVEFEGVNAINGQYTVQEAMAILLHDTGLTSGLTESGMIVITREDSANAHNREEKMTSKNLKKGLLAGVATLLFGGAQAQDVEAVDEVQDDEQAEDVIVVTGTNIRGVSPDSSPSLVFDREDIDKTGFGTVSDFVQSLPQNFGGGANSSTQAGLPNDRTATQNPSLGSSVNLRGLGSGSTLVLLNGTRLAPAGNIGDFVDISMIPLSAVERVEVLTDGASAIYGADAIAGVVNFVLRDDYDGAETFVRYGAVTEGDLNEYRAGQTLGKSWDTGNALVSYEFFHRDNLGAEDKDFSSTVPLPNDVMPEQESHNVLLTVSKEIGEHVVLRGHGAFSQRDSNRASTFGGLTTVGDSRTKQYGGAGGAAIRLVDEWVLDLSGGYSKLESLLESMGPFPGIAQTDSTIWSVEGKTDGTLIRLRGGDIKIAVGGSYREENFSNGFSSGVFTDDERTVFGAYGEAFFPIIGADNRTPGIERLEFTLAGRYDDYSDFGDTLNPKVGLLWSPLGDLNFRGTYSTSFNPPNLGDIGQVSNGTVFPFFVPNPESPAGVSLAIFDGRPNRNLSPETSTSWTAGLDFQHEIGSGNLNVSATLFDIDFKDRIGEAGSVFQYLISPDVFADVIVPNPDPALTAAIVAEASVFADLSAGAWATPGDEDFILIASLQNLSRVDTTGLDINFSYSVDTDIGQLSFSSNGSYLFRQEKQITSNAPDFDVVDTIFNPVNFRLRSSMSLTHEGLNASAFVNYVDGYVDDRNIIGGGDVSVDSWTTVDLNLGYDTRDKVPAELLRNTKLSFSAQNLFNNEHPKVAVVPFGGSDFGFDPTNANPLGRFISFQVTKTW